MADSRSPFERSPLQTIFGIVVAVVVIYVLFKIVGWIISLLYMVAPLLLIASLIIDHKVFMGYVNWIKELFQRKPVYGLIATLGSLVLYPFVFLYMLGMALFKKRVAQAREEAEARRDGRWTNYEEVTDDGLDVEETDFEVLPPPPPPKVRREDNNYDELFN